MNVPCRHPTALMRLTAAAVVAAAADEVFQRQSRTLRLPRWQRVAVAVVAVETVRLLDRRRRRQRGGSAAG